MVPLQMGNQRWKGLAGAALHAASLEAGGDISPLGWGKLGLLVGLGNLCCRMWDLREKRE